MLSREQIGGVKECGDQSQQIAQGARVGEGGRVLGCEPIGAENQQHTDQSDEQSKPESPAQAFAKDQPGSQRDED